MNKKILQTTLLALIAVTKITAEKSLMRPEIHLTQI